MGNGSMYPGLTSAQAAALQEEYGKNELSPQKKPSFLKKALSVLSQPMFLLLISAAAIYFLLGKPGDGAIMLIFVIAVISIEIIQEWRIDRTGTFSKQTILNLSGKIDLSL